MTHFGLGVVIKVISLSRAPLLNQPDDREAGQRKARVQALPSEYEALSSSSSVYRGCTLVHTGPSSTRGQNWELRSCVMRY